MKKWWSVRNLETFDDTYDFQLGPSGESWTSLNFNNRAHEKFGQLAFGRIDISPERWNNRN